MAYPVPTTYAQSASYSGSPWTISLFYRIHVSPMYSFPWQIQANIPPMAGCYPLKGIWTSKGTLSKAISIALARVLVCFSIQFPTEYGRLAGAEDGFYRHQLKPTLLRYILRQSPFQSRADPQGKYLTPHKSHTRCSVLGNMFHSPNRTPWHAKPEASPPVLFA